MFISNPLQDEMVTMYRWNCPELNRETVAVKPVGAIQKLLTCKNIYAKGTKNRQRFRVFGFQENDYWFRVLDAKTGNVYHLCRSIESSMQPHRVI